MAALAAFVRKLNETCSIPHLGFDSVGIRKHVIDKRRYVRKGYDHENVRDRNRIIVMGNDI